MSNATLCSTCHSDSYYQGAVQLDQNGDHPMQNAALECIDPMDKALQSPLFQLPYELRSTIFWWSIKLSGILSPKQLYHPTFTSGVWKDRLTPLLGTSKQTRREVIDLLRCYPEYTLRVTTVGLAFDMYSLSCFISLGIPTILGYSPETRLVPFALTNDLSITQIFKGKNMPEIKIEIWPPHGSNHSYCEVPSILENLRRIRPTCSHASASNVQLSLVFMESEFGNWSPSNHVKQLGYYQMHGYGPLEYDHRYVTMILDHFAEYWSVKSLNVRVPPSLQRDEDVSLVAQRRKDSRGWPYPNSDLTCAVGEAIVLTEDIWWEWELSFQGRVTFFR